MSAPLVSNPVSIFLVVLGIILLVPLVLQRLKIPYVIGLIIAGIIVGPYGLNVLARDMSFEVFGQVGILYLMFLAGLEIDMFHLRKNISRGFVFGAFTFAIPLVLGAFVARYALGLEWLASWLLASLFSAHTLLAYPIVSRFGLTRSRSVVIAVAGTIFTVIGALMVLAGVGTVARRGAFSPLETIKLFGVLAAFCLITLYVYPRLTRWFFKQYMERVTQFIYVLAMVFLAAAVARWIGIEGVFGAFFAGLVLNRYIPARSPLMTRLEFVGNAIFIPYFLIGVGMMINLGVLTAGWTTLKVAAIMSAVAMATKWLAAWLTQKTFRMGALDRSMLFQLSNAHTVVALAVVTIGYNLSLFGEEILNATILMILVTCTVSTLGTERASRRLKLLELEEGPTTSVNKPDKPHTLITVSNPITVGQLVEMAMLMRGPVSPDSPLYALHVRNENSPVAVDMARTSLELAERAASAVDSRIETIDRFDNNVITGVLNTMAERHISEVFIGLHRRGPLPIDSFLGSKLEQLVNSTNKMIVVNRCFIPANTLTRIPVYVPEKAEYETGFRRWVEALATLAGQLGCRLIFWCYPATRRAIRTLLGLGRWDVRVEYHTMEAPDEYIMLANEVLDDDLFVVVTSRRASVSFSPELDALPAFLERYFSRNNLAIIYPEQFGPEPMRETLAVALSADFTATPSPLWLRLTAAWRRLIVMRKRFTQRNRHRKIEL